MAKPEESLALSHFDYELDSTLVAVAPTKERDTSRLLVYHRDRQVIEHRSFKALSEYLNVSDLLVFNNTRVFPARCYAEKRTGGKLELLFLRPAEKKQVQQKFVGLCWEVLIKGKSAPSTQLTFKGGVSGEVILDLEGGRKLLKLDLPPSRYSDIFAFLSEWGEVPLPPYIVKRRNPELPGTEDQSRYQTVFAEHWGSAAAPTAGLHFTKKMIEAIKAKGIQTATTTLHIGLDTFLPIRVDTILEHKMHSEWFKVSDETAKKVKQCRHKKGKVIAVGTTVTRALESAIQPDGSVGGMEGDTDIFIKPGYVFKGIDAMITNFHLPKSTLLVMISAFAGLESVKMIYDEAKRERYRFYSYGDAMLIL